MKHFFIINPAAGTQNTGEDIDQHLKARPELWAQVYRTQKPLDAMHYVQSQCAQNEGELRFYACGGDGTLNEVLNGMVGCPRAALGCWPSGSGNDYIKYYGTRQDFLNFDAQINGTTSEVDLMKTMDRYAINVINFGFDTLAAQTMQSTRHIPLLRGKNGYLVGVGYAFIKAIKNDCRVWSEGELLNPDGKMLLCTAACGQYQGGRFRCAPRSLNDDGYIDLCLIKPISRLQLILMIRHYAKGHHLDLPSLAPHLVYRRTKNIHLEAREGWALTLDGENVPSSCADISMVRHAIRFIIPKGMSPTTH